MRFFEGVEAPVRCLAYSPDGSTLASGGDDRTVRLWEPATGRVRASEAGAPEGVVRLAYRPDGGWLASGTRRGSIQLRDPATAEVRLRYGVPGFLPTRQRGPILALAFVAGGRALLSVGGGPVVEIAEEPVTIDQVVVRFPESGQLVPLAGFDAIWGFAGDSEGRRLFFGYGPGYLSVWRAGASGFDKLGRSQGPTPQQGVHHHRVGEQRPKRFPRKGPKQPAVERPLAASPDGRLVAAPWDNIVEIWDADEMRQVAAPERHPSEILALAFRPDGLILASAALDGAVRLWDARDGRPLGRYDWEIGPVHCLAFAPDGMTMAAGGESGLVVFDVDELGC